MIIHSIRILFIGLACLAASAVCGQTVNRVKPTGPVILTVSGAITKTNSPDAYVFDAEMIDSLPTHQITTLTPWYKEPITASGPFLRDVLQLVGATGQNLKIKALNDYIASVPVSDASAYSPILARRINGAVLSKRDKGPLFLVYPYSSYPEINNNVFFFRSIWQIAEIQIQ